MSLTLEEYREIMIWYAKTKYYEQKFGNAAPPIDRDMENRLHRKLRNDHLIIFIDRWQVNNRPRKVHNLIFSKFVIVLHRNDYMIFKNFSNVAHKLPVRDVNLISNADGFAKCGVVNCNFLIASLDCLIDANL